MAEVHTDAPAPGPTPGQGEHVLAAARPATDDRSVADVTPATGRQAVGGRPGVADPAHDAISPATAAADPADDAIVGLGPFDDGDGPGGLPRGRPTGPGEPGAGPGTPGDLPAAPPDREEYASARVVMARVLGLTGARSVVDVGCGSGAWTQACRDLGVPEVVGIDGSGVPPDRRRGREVVEHDLARPLDLGRRFSLAICVDVGEHLAPQRAAGLVAELTALAPIVLFSAAVPGQARTPHANDRWPEYWVALFEAHGWTCRDAIRPWVRTNEDVAWWHRQTAYLAVGPATEAAYTSFPRLAAVRPEHPVDYLLRPPGDVMTVPPPPPPPPPGLPEVRADPGAGEQVPQHAAGTPESPDEADGRATGDDESTGAPGDPPAAPAPLAPWTDEDLLFPEPPGWSAIRRMAGRVRRRGRG